MSSGSELGYRTASTGLLRDLNRSAIFRTIALSGPIARTHVARSLGLSPATVTAVTRELIDQGLLRVAERAPSRGGRPALLLEVVGGAAAAFGLKIAPDHLVGVRVDLEAHVLERYEAPFDPAAADAVQQLGHVVTEWVDEARSAVPLLGVGIGVSGVVEDGLLDSPLLGWRELPLARQLQERLELPVYVDNDVNTLAVFERLHGRGSGAQHFVTVTVGRGVGLGIIAGGDIYRGFRGGAGEFGHVVVAPDGSRCSCGKRGCLETVVADPALVARARRARLLSKDQGIARLRELADGGNAKAQEIFGSAGETLGRAVANVVNVLSPELVLVSGEGAQAWPHLADRFDAGLTEALFPPLGRVRVEVDPWDDAKWAVGAASLVLRASFAAPLEGGRMEVVA